MRLSPGRTCVEFSVILTVAYVAVTTAAVDRNKRIVGGEPSLPPRNLTAMAAGSGAPATNTSRGNDDVVFIYDEPRRSRLSGVRGPRGYFHFLGIRFAEPPLGPNRLQRPILLPLEGDVDAKVFGKPCLQPAPRGTGMLGSEDCLYLNVYTPRLQNATFPVLFWIHGGGFIRGSSAQYDPTHLLDKRLVVVTVQYRLGSLGWLGTNNKQLPGNAGIFDVRAALYWTRRYISHFGGDPDRIFVSGQGTGASIATLLAQSTFTSDVIRGVFAMSGTGLSSNAIDYKPVITHSAIASTSRCLNLPPLESVRCLQEIPASQLISADRLLMADRINKGGFVSALAELGTAGPVVEGMDDGRFLQFYLNEPPLESLKRAKYPNIPLLVGVTKHETYKAIFGKFRRDVENRLRISGYFQNQLPINLLQSNTGLFNNGTINRALNQLFGNPDYLNLIASTLTPGLSELEKVVEMTTDALFNLPAVSLSAIWNRQGGNPYFYSFEQVPKQETSQLFLDGLPIVATKPTVGHGEDLHYLFDVRSLEGQPIPNTELRDFRDIKTRDIFTTAVSQFLYTGMPVVPELGQPWPIFNRQTSEYVVISDAVRVEQGFRQCQMALWAGFADVLQSAACNFPGIDAILQGAPDLLNDGVLSASAPIQVTQSLGGSAPDSNTIQSPNLEPGSAPDSSPSIDVPNQRPSTIDTTLNGISPSFPPGNVLPGDFFNPQLLSPHLNPQVASSGSISSAHFTNALLPVTINGPISSQPSFGSSSSFSFESQNNISPSPFTPTTSLHLPNNRPMYTFVAPHFVPTFQTSPPASSYHYPYPVSNGGHHYQHHHHHSGYGYSKITTNGRFFG